MQILFGAGSRASGESFVLKSEAATRSSQYLMRKRFFYYNPEKDVYELDPNETEELYVDRGTIQPVEFQTREGYTYTKMVFNRTYTVYNELSIIMNGPAYLDIYFDPIPKYEQTYRYYLSDPVTGKYTLIKTESDWPYIKTQYTTRVEIPQGSHIAKVYRNGYRFDFQSNYTWLVCNNEFFDIYLDPNRTTLEFYDEGNLIGKQQVFYGEKKTLMENPLKKPGYEFVGWKTTIGNEVVIYSDREEFQTPFAEDGAVIRLEAEWKAVLTDLRLRYHTAGKDQEAIYVEDIYEWEDSIVFRDQEKTEKPAKPATLLGWSTKADTREVVFSGGMQMSVEELYEKICELELVDEEEKNPILDLYAVWDMAPLFGTTHIYITQRDALEGTVTPEFLIQKLNISDQEEGRLNLQKESGSKEAGVCFTNYDAWSFLTGEPGDVVLTVQARDSVGNITIEQIVCTVVESNGVYLGKLKKVRFISEEYLDTLDEDSVWRCDRQYRTVLEEVLEKARCICISLSLFMTNKVACRLI